MGKFVDLSGQQFNEITVLEKDETLSKEKGRTYWKCQCSCGKIKSIRGDGLKKIQTCGECANDLTNQKFGRLLVLYKGKKDKAGHQFWFCKCDCDNIVEVNSDNLRRGLTQSCGCLHSEITHKTKFKDITGQKFGKLTANNYEIIGSKTYWNCTCECGNNIKVASNNLKNGHTTSCGCINYSIGEQNITQVLKDNNIIYISQFKFDDFKNRIYDFYLPEYNRLIEFDGKQHFKLGVSGWYSNEAEFLKAKQRDIEKNQYALLHNISLIRIPYWERDNITLDLILGNKYLINNLEEAEEIINEHKGE